jgi:hypothetical protein
MTTGRPVTLAPRRAVVLDQAWLDSCASAGSPIPDDLPPLDSDQSFGQRTRLNWLGLAEKILGGWPTTLRTAVLLIIVLTGLITIIIAVLGFVRALPATEVGIGIMLRVLACRLARPAHR